MNKMLPYEEIWKILNNLLNNSSMLMGDKNNSRYEEDVFRHLIDETDDYYMNAFNLLSQIDDLVWEIPGADFSYRYKSVCSQQQKFAGLEMTKTLYKVANDLLELRFVLKTSKENLKTMVDEFVSLCPFSEVIRQIVSQTIGKETDFGYISVYLHFRVNNQLFPMKISFYTRTNVLLNEYLQADLNKIEDLEFIRHALDLRNWLESVSQIPEGNRSRVQSYVDYIYEKDFPIEEENLVLSGEDECLFEEGKRMSKVFIYSGDTKELIIAESLDTNTAKDTYKHIKKLIPTANMEVLGARDLQTLLRTNRELRTINMTTNIYQFLKDISKSKNAFAH